eukprot:TRINITY_DN2811_c0_g1_i1.p1 TRINITY_DN2811_c0_g1~~TRINITY_DN2811_c0_g1_i1.p1  ORF type:complete len:279 (-),score=52.32 TRINITY_DN2811_c0_g1_i1:184-1020(-)
MTDLFLDRRVPVQLLRVKLKAVIILCAMRFGLAPRTIQEGLSRWWPHQLVSSRSADGEAVAPHWPLGIRVRIRFLPLKLVKAGRKAGSVLPADAPVSADAEDAAADQTHLLEETMVFILDAISASENHCKHKEAFAVLLLLWDEPRCKSIMEHKVFKADHLAMQRKAVQKRKSPSGSYAHAANVRESVGPTLVPRPMTNQAAGGGKSRVLAARAAAQAIAASVTPTVALVVNNAGAAGASGTVADERTAGGPSAGAPAQELVQEPSSSNPLKRLRQGT